MGKSTISVAILNGKLLVYQRVYPINIPLNHYKIPLNHYNIPLNHHNRISWFFFEALMILAPWKAIFLIDGSAIGSSR